MPELFFEMMKNILLDLFQAYKIERTSLLV